MQIGNGFDPQARKVRRLLSPERIDLSEERYGDAEYAHVVLRLFHAQSISLLGAPNQSEESMSIRCYLYKSSSLGARQKSVSKTSNPRRTGNNLLRGSIYSVAYRAFLVRTHEVNTVIRRIFRSRMATLHASKHRGHNRGSKGAFFESGNSPSLSRLLKGWYEALVSLVTTDICQYPTGHDPVKVCIRWLVGNRYSEKYK